MLPILKRLREKQEPKQTGVSVIERSSPSQDPVTDIEQCSVSILMAIAAKDPKALSQALYDAFCIMDAAPHEEGQHSPHTYEAQNQKAGE